MKLGTACADITPAVGTDLCGYLAREKPSTAVLDPLHAKALHLQDGEQRLLWIAADLIAFDRALVGDFRDWAKQHLSLEPHQLLLSATHTHAGPATVQLNCCGNPNPTYRPQLISQLQEVAQRAVESAETCDLVVSQATLDLAIDRRNKPSAHTDPHALAIGWRRQSGEFVAVLLNYPMHPVALGSVNRQLSRDFPGPAVDAVSEALPGKPLVLYTNGACGNLNPPALDLAPDALQALGRKIADAVIPGLREAKPVLDATLATRLEIIPLPLDTLDAGQIDKIAEQYIQRTWIDSPQWNQQFVAAIETWRTSMKQAIRQPRSDVLDFDLQVVRLGNLHFVAVNGEMFSRFTDCVRRKTSKAGVYTVSYANRGYGYIPTAEAYSEGGYEVETAHFFYNSFRPKIGGLELLCEHAARMIRSL